MQEASADALEQAKVLIKRCTIMSKELRGTDILAHRVRQLRNSLEQLETQVDVLLR